jgi:glyoxylase-like metal-dependent hydrolase (beta-lactamase superfamily II)
MLADPKTPEAQRAELQRGRDVIDHPDWLRPTQPVTKTMTTVIAGRTLELHVAPFAATEADLWVFDPSTRDLFAGDLVVGLVPFLDTACPRGWKAALGELAAKPFVRLVPGHGAPMTRAEFDRWRSAFDALLACSASPAPDAQCIDGWLRDAAPFIDSEHADYVRAALGYYLHERLRSPEAEKTYCAPLSPGP